MYKIGVSKLSVLEITVIFSFSQQKLPDSGQTIICA